MAILVDVREADEYAREHIRRRPPASVLAPPGHALPRVPGKARAPVQQRQPHAQGRGGDALREPIKPYDLAGGIQAWKRDGLPVEADRGAPRPIMRQVQIAAGSLVLSGLLLALLLSPWFALLSACVGAGLLFAGIAGRCGMAKLLERLPYDRRPRTPPPCDRGDLPLRHERDEGAIGSGAELPGIAPGRARGDPCSHVEPARSATGSSTAPHARAPAGAGADSTVPRTTRGKS